MDQIPHGMRGDFRKVTITLPPSTYELLLQEASRRKIAGEAGHALSDIAREGIARVLAQTPLLPIETTELEIYRYMAVVRAGEWRPLDSLNYLGNMVAEADTGLLEQLIVDLVRQGWLAVEKYADNGRYLPLVHWQDPGRELYSGTIRMQLTIAGRRRFEGLQARNKLGEEKLNQAG